MVGSAFRRPPTISTRPSRSSAAPWPVRGAAIGPVGLLWPVAGSKTPAVASTVVVPASVPPAMRTRPSGSRIAVWPMRRAPDPETGVKPTGATASGLASAASGESAGSKRSTSTPLLPVSSTLPSLKRVALTANELPRASPGSDPADDARRAALRVEDFDGTRIRHPCWCRPRRGPGRRRGPRR